MRNYWALFRTRPNTRPLAGGMKGALGIRRRSRLLSERTRPDTAPLAVRSGSLIFIFLGILVFAQKETLPGITFPIAELGNCASQAECEAHCELPENMLACLDFAEAHNLTPKEEAAMARKMLELGETAGPGGCRGKVKCEAYCDDISHIEECVSFAERHGLIPPQELEEGKKVVAAIKQGIKPPNCRSKSACDVYCMAPENMEECMNFAIAAGLMPAEDLETAPKVLEAIKKGAKPPPCRGEKECDIYCSIPEHFEECITFAEAAGFVSPEEAAMARRTGGRGPGGCRGKEACDAFCEDPANMEECVSFAEEFGFISHQDAENAKKMLRAGFSGGPGNCKGKEECEAYCNDLVHLEECVNFAEKMGFMSSEDAERARRMAERGVNVMQGGPGGCKGKEECEAFCQEPANMEVCIDFAVKIGDMTPEQAEQAKKGMETMQKGGLGGCKSEQECRIYCESPAHAEECINFAIQQGFMSPEEGQKMLEMMRMPSPEMGPAPEMPLEGMPPSPPPEGIPSEGALPTIPPIFEGKCANPQECREYCFQNSQDPACQAMMPQIPPPAEVPPPEAAQSFFDRIQNFLAGLIPILKEK